MKGIKNAYVGLQNTFNIKATTGSFSNSLNLTGATVDFKDAVILNFALDSIYTDFIFEKTTDAGVTIDGLLLQDGKCDGVNVSGFYLDYQSKINQALLATSSPTFSNLTLSGFGTSAGFVKRQSNGVLTVDTTSYESPLTFSAPLIRTVNTISLDTVLPITQISNLTTAGFVKSDAKGNLSVDTTGYLNKAGDSMTGTLDMKSNPITNVKLGSLSTNGFIKTSSSDGTLSIDTTSYLPSSTTYVASITGTASQVIASASTGAITLSLPQDIATTSSPQFAKNTLLAANTTTALLCTSNPTLTDQCGLLIQPYFDATYYDATRLFFKQTTDNKNGFSVGSCGSGTSAILNWNTNTFNISRHENDLNGVPSLVLNRAGGMTINEDLLIDNKTTTYYGGITMTSGALKINTLTASALVATNATSQLTTSVSGLSPSFTGLTLSGLNATQLIATNGSKALTNTTSACTPTFGGLTVTQSQASLSTFLFSNDNAANNAASAMIEIRTQGPSTNSPFIRFNVGAVGGWSCGSHQASSNRFAVSYGTPATPGTNDRLVISTAGVVGIPNLGTTASLVSVDASSNLVVAPTSLSPTFTNQTLSGTLTMSGTGSNRITFAQAFQNRILEMYRVANNDHQFLGFGVNAGVLRYQVNTTTDSNVWYVATSTTTSSELFRITGTAQAQAQDGSAAAPAYSFNNDSDCGMYRIATNNIGIACGGVKVLDAISNGYITMPIQPSFNAHLSNVVNDFSGDGTVYTLLCNVENHDRGSNYTPGTGIFLTPVAGVYFFQVSVGLQGLLSGHTSAELIISDGTTSYASSRINPFACRNTALSACTMNVSTTISLAASVSIRCTISVSGSTKVVDLVSLQSYTNFSGQLLS